MRHWLKEPLLHFLVAGELLFAAYAWLNRGGGEAPRVVRITAKEKARVAAKVGLIDPDQRW